MKNLRIGVQLWMGFGLMILLVLASSTMMLLETSQSDERSNEAWQGMTGAVVLAEAQSALWQLRYGFPQFMVGD